MIEEVNNESENYYYLINKNNINEFNSIFKINEIYNIIIINNRHYFINYYLNFK